MTKYRHLKLGVDDHVATITIDHPPANTLDTQTMTDLETAFEEVTNDPHVKAIVITGAGKFAFVAGADINEIGQIRTRDEARRLMLRGQALFNQIEASHKPFIAAVDGVCLGGGAELAMACHMRIAGDNARFGQPEINLGLMPGWGGTQRLPRYVGEGKALELLLTGGMIGAQEAHRIGLVNQVVPPGQAVRAAQELAKTVASRSAIVIASILDAVRAGLRGSLDDGLRYEADKFAALVETHDMREGVSAFLEKRPPVFEDR